MHAFELMSQVRMVGIEHKQRLKISLESELLTVPACDVEDGVRAL
jgi:hypothetical protein